MAGGSGERFWPMSRENKPKQLLNLTNSEQNLLEEAVERIAPLVGKGNVYIATGKNLKDAMVASNLVAPSQLLVEPSKRNTLGALCWVAASLIARQPNGWRETVLAILTADHHIGSPEEFRQTVDTALEVARKSAGLVTIGIKPARPETGYGYIEPDLSAPVPVAPGSVHKAKSFREKPDADAAARYVEAGFLWNSGMFFWTLGSFWDALAETQPEALEVVRSVSEALKVGDEETAEKAFNDLPNLSIDYAVLEKAPSVFVVRGDFPWDDVGAWDSLERTLRRKAGENVFEGDVVALDMKTSIVINGSKEMAVGVLGLEDLIVVVTDDAVLVCPKSRSQEVRRVVEQLRERGSTAI
jgi:mannose-1-phosphate guanylyltransferase